MSELRTRMIRDMTVRGFFPRTHEAYLPFPWADVSRSSRTHSQTEPSA
jgi:hypothetical protein